MRALNKACVLNLACLAFYQGGKTLVIRCGTWPEHQDWRKALERESKAKVKREHFQLVKEKVFEKLEVLKI